MALGFIIVTLSVIAIVAVGGMAFMMWYQGFKLPMALGFVAGLAVFGLLLSINDPATARAHPPVTDPVPAALILGLAIAAGLMLLFVGGQLVAGVFTNNRTQVTSWPMQQEQAFQPFEQRIAWSGRNSMLIGACASGAVLVFAFAVIFGVEPDLRDQERFKKTMNMSNLTKKTTDAPTPTPTPTPTPAPAPAP